MEQNQTYQFDDEEVHMLSEAMALYASYMQHMVLPNLIGDESDADTLTARSAHAKSMAIKFFEEDGDETWQEMNAQFASYHNRPMDVSDVSPFDFCEYANNSVEE